MGSDATTAKPTEHSTPASGPSKPRVSLLYKGKEISGPDDDLATMRKKLKAHLEDVAPSDKASEK